MSAIIARVIGRRRHRMSVPDDRRATPEERAYIRCVAILAAVHERAVIERAGHPVAAIVSH